MKRTLAITSIILTLVGSLVSAKAFTGITYGLSSLGGNQWQYSYSVNNNTIGAPITDFLVYFPDVSSSEYSYYTLLGGTGSGGFSFVTPPVQPSAPNLGGFAEFSGGSIPVGNTLSGFTVDFSYTGSASLGSQSFEVYDSSTFDLLDSGRTTPQGSPGVPDGGATLTYALLAGLSLLGLGRLQPEWSGRQKN